MMRARPPPLIGWHFVQYTAERCRVLSSVAAVDVHMVLPIHRTLRHRVCDIVLAFTCSNFRSTTFLQIVSNISWLNGFHVSQCALYSIHAPYTHRLQCSSSPIYQYHVHNIILKDINLSRKRVNAKLNRNKNDQRVLGSLINNRQDIRTQNERRTKNAKERWNRFNDRLSCSLGRRLTKNQHEIQFFR